MSPELVSALIVLFTAGAGGIGFFFRGQVRSTNADKLWDAAEQMRKEQAGEIVEQRHQILELTVRVTTLEGDLKLAEAKSVGLSSQVNRLSHENDRLKDHIDRMMKNKGEKE